MHIWQATKGEKHLVTISEKIQRMVESQSYIATRSLVDSDEEQRILEEELEKSKPPFPERNGRGKLHWLLFTPFRYPPLQNGGRFHSRTEQSLFYGAKELETVMAEIAYKRFVFRACSKATIQAMNVDYTKFAVKIKTNKGIDLTATPFSRYRNIISNPLSHIESQTLGHEMRNAGVEAFLFFSARVKNGINCGAISVEAFANNKPEENDDWVIYDSEQFIEFRRHLPIKKSETKIFPLKNFLVGGSLPLFS